MCCANPVIACIEALSDPASYSVGWSTTQLRERLYSGSHRPPRLTSLFHSRHTFSAALELRVDHRSRESRVDEQSRNSHLTGHRWVTIGRSCCCCQFSKERLQQGWFYRRGGILDRYSTHRVEYLLESGAYLHEQRHHQHTNQCIKPYISPVNTEASVSCVCSMLLPNAADTLDHSAQCIVASNLRWSSLLLYVSPSDTGHPPEQHVNRKPISSIYLSM
jgi:hypothetical protein